MFLNFQILFLTSVSPRKCEAARDGLAKALYGRLFDWVVDRINLLGSDPSSAKTNTSIDILVRGLWL